MAVKVADDVLEVIAEAELSEQGVKLVQQLDRKLYQKVAKALEACGFKWDRRAQMHLGNAPELIEQLVNTGEYTDAKKEFEAFYTPDALADLVVSVAELEPGMRVLEPSFGDGALLRAVSRAGVAVEILGVEVRFDPAEEMHSGLVGLKCAYGGDFLDCRVPLPGDSVAETTPLLGLFDRVVMNPPFSRCQDALHILHAMQFVKPGGKIVAIASPGVTFRQDRPYQQLLDAIEGRGLGDHRGWEGDVRKLPDNSFASSGTNVRTVMIVLERAF